MPRGLGEVAHTRGVEQVHDEAVGFQRLDNGTLIVAAGLQRDFGDAGLAQAAGQAGQAAFVAADNEVQMACQDMNVEPVLADVDAGDVLQGRPSS